MQYRTGTISVTNGTITVIGNSTNWDSDYISAGDTLKVEGINAIFTIESVLSTTAIQINTPYPGESDDGLNYQIHRDFTSNFRIPEINEGDRDWPFYITRGLRIIDEVAAGGTLTASLYETTDLEHQEYSGITARMYDNNNNAFGKLLTGAGAVASSSATTSLPATHMTISANTPAGWYTCLIQGFVRNAAWNFAASKLGFPIYATTSGNMTTTAIAVGSYEQIVGIVVTTNTVYFNPSPNYKEK
jgi:hypothetical protein